MYMLKQSLQNNRTRAVSKQQDLAALIIHQSELDDAKKSFAKGQGEFKEMYEKAKGIKWGNGPSFRTIIDGLRAHHMEHHVANKDTLSKEDLAVVHLGVHKTWDLFLDNDPLEWIDEMAKHRGGKHYDNDRSIEAFEL